MHPQLIGTVIGAIGATAFVHANRGTLPGPWPVIAVLAWAVALVTLVWAALVRPRSLPVLAPPGPRAGLVYVASVIAMLVVIAAGGAVVRAAGRPELQPVVVVIAVGLHFVPFAAAFRAPVFTVLGWCLVAIGVVGLLLGLAAGAVAVAGAAVVTGLVMLVLMTVEVVGPSRRPW